MALSREAVKEKFIREGRTVTSWAKEHGFRTNDVYQVLNGVSQGKYGIKHQIAVQLGIKEPPINN